MTNIRWIKVTRCNQKLFIWHKSFLLLCVPSASPAALHLWLILQWNILHFPSQLPEIKPLVERLPGSLAFSTFCQGAAKPLLDFFFFFGRSSVTDVRILAFEDTLQVAPFWQVSIGAIDSKLKCGTGWSIIRVHSGHGCSVTHGLCLPGTQTIHCDQSPIK